MVQVPVAQALWQGLETQVVAQGAETSQVGAGAQVCLQGFTFLHLTLGHFTFTVLHLTGLHFAGLQHFAASAEFARTSANAATATTLISLRIIVQLRVFTFGTSLSSAAPSPNPHLGGQRVNLRFLRSGKHCRSR